MEILTKLMNLPEIEIVRVEIIENELHIYSNSSLNFGYCPLGGEMVSNTKSYHERVIRDLSICGKLVYIYLKVRQLYCKEHGEYFYQSFSFVEPNAVLTNRYKEYIYNSCKGVDIKYVATRENLSWDTVNDLFKNYSQQEIEKKKTSVLSSYNCRI